MTQTQTRTREVLEVTHPDGRIEYLTKENYLGFGEWKHDLIVESTRNDSGEPVLTGRSGAIYRLKKLSFDYPLTGGRLPVSLGTATENTEEKQMPTQVAKTFTHPHLTRFNGIFFPELPADVKEFDKPESELQAMSYQDLEDAVEILQDPDFGGLDHHSPWVTMYAVYRNSSQMNGRKSWLEANPPVVSTPVVEEKQMSTQVAPMPISSKSPVFLAAHEPATLDIIEDLLLNVSHDTSLTDDLILTIQAYIASEGKDGNKSHDELGQLARKAKMWGVFKLCGQVKGSEEFQSLIAKHTPEIEVVGGNQMGQVISVGTTAKEVASPIKEDWLSQLPVVTDTPQDLLKAHGLTKTGKPAKGGKGTKAAKEKPAKKEKVAKTPKVKEVKILPLPTIQDIAALEALDRKGLQQAMSALNTHKVTGVKGNATSDAIKVALAKELLGIENYVPAPKPEKVKGSKTPETPLPMPESISWQEVLEMSYKQLQQFCKVLRSNGLFEGNVGGAGSGKVILLEKAANAMRQLGHDIQALEISAQNPDTATPTLERNGMKYDLMCQATALLAA